MATIKKNIWTLFFITLFIGVFIVSILIYKINNDETNNFYKEHTTLTKIIAGSVNSILLQYELLLDVLIEQLKKNNNYANENSAKETMMTFQGLKSIIIIIDFGIIRPDGQLYAATNNIDDLSLNLLKKKETKESFLQTLEKDTMVLGRTYFNQTFQKHIIPFRKAARDENGNVIFVISSVLDVHKNMNLEKDTSHKTFVIRDIDKYIQFSNKIDNNTFTKPINVPKSFYKSLKENYNLSLKEIKKNEKTVSFLSNENGKSYINFVKFIKKHDLWIAVQVPNDILSTEILKKSLVVLVVFFFIMAILFFFFKYIYDFETTKRKALNYQATHDPLTKLNNRLFLTKEFEEKRDNYPFSLLFIDLDNFKKVNENYGINYGDIVLRIVANRLIDIKKHSDSLIRYSSDEFLFITKTLNKQKLNELARIILDELSKPYLIGEYKFNISSSIGISKFPDDSNNITDIISYADLAMNEAKKEKNSFYIFEGSIKDKYQRDFQIENELKTAINDNEIYLVYQPQCDNKGNILGVEALVRWENENLGFIPPDQFIKIAESSGHMIELGTYIYETAMKEIQTIKKETNKNFRLSINISLKQFMSLNFYENLFMYIDNTNFDKNNLTLEVTENIFIEDIGYILQLLEKIKQTGIQISLDDFGTGYSSLNVLKKLPIDELKIDKSFIDDISKDKESKKMVQSIISISKDFDLSIVAEGVENKEQKDILENYKCGIFQGYYYSKPLKKDDLIKYLLKNSN